MELVTPQPPKKRGRPAGKPNRQTALLALCNRPAIATVDRPVPTEEGAPTALTLPVKELTRKQYNAEMLRSGKLTGFRRFLKSIELNDLKYALAREDKAKSLDFLAALMDPDNKELDVAEIALRQGIGLGELMSIWRNDRLTETFSTLFTAAPKVAGDAVEDALSKTICCPRCDGAGSIRVTRQKGPAWIICPQCEGVGSTRKQGDAKAREIVLRATGVIKPDTGMAININTAPSAVDSVLDELERATTTIDVHPNA